MNDTWWREFQPPHPIIVAALPCESRNTKNVKYYRGILPKKLASYVSGIMYQQMLYGNGLGSWVLYLLVYTKQWFMTLMTCRNAWCKLALTLNRALYTTLRLTSAWHDRMRSVVRAGGGHFETRHTKCRLETRDLKWIIICMIHQNFHQNAMKLSV